MANFDKHDLKTAQRILRHNSRSVKNPSNVDIRPELSYKNYSLIPPHFDFSKGDIRFMSDYEYLQKTINRPDIYKYKRDDVKVLCSWIVQTPKGLPEDKLNLFFNETFNFLSKKYPYVISAKVHVDENTPHMHYTFVPVVPVKDDRQKQRFGGKELKISANDLVNKKHLKDFHKELRDYLVKHVGPDAAGVVTGETALKGNRTIRELKEIRELGELNRELTEQNRELGEQNRGLAEQNRELKQENQQLREQLRYRQERQEQKQEQFKYQQERQTYQQERQTQEREQLQHQQKQRVQEPQHRQDRQPLEWVR